MAHGAVKPCCCCCLLVAAALAVAVFLAMPPPAAAASSSQPAALQRAEKTAAMYTAKELREKQDVTKGAEEDVTTTGFGAESEREVPTGPDPIHHHGRGPRRQSP
uniref:SMP domain-containing protein n=1 Tax=Oryza punctata TaxID=4537 RepID=A0A0E0KRT2_ORYPU